ncbi:ComEC/Rec2 family competence protein [Mycobacterium sp. 852014-52144_SCH5372336]|uniref:ComEC/Rec2 family competence protein n=1 Tax=Mycobacterium sp. 852014-52144_SCH5372336 TaxID=1834115 RepID=UPI0007FF72D0|nr:ComEC/Rec2 family competence protein [Mycobacterium sp. 852014-52144_SCH5372336]OBB71944.1 competence protein [Mycobacterium sp. 852014-52144_SCH5372336]
MADADAAPLDLRLVPAALTGWAVTGAGILWPVGGSAVAAVGAVGATAALGWWGSGRRAATDGKGVGASVLAVGLVAAGFAIAIGLRVDEVREHPVTQRYGTAATVVVTPTESPRALGGNRTMFRGALVVLDGHEMSGRVVVFASTSRIGELTAGTPVAFRARIGPPTRRDLSVAVLSAIGDPTYGEASAVQRAAAEVRAGFAEAARRSLPADQAAMLPALVLGDTSSVPRQTTADFRAAGLTHLTAVSGANVTIVCGAVLLTAGVVGPRAAVGLAAVALLAFVVVVQPTASVLRAAVMGAITLLAVLSHRRRQAIPALSASVLALMIGSPELAVDVGFALSVSATAALVVLAPVWSRRLVDRGWPKPAADALSVAAAAQLVTAPLVAGMAGTFSVVSVAANVAVAPVIPPITVLGTAAAGLGGIWPAGADLLIRFTGPEVWWLLHVARWAAGVPGSTVSVPSGLPGVMLTAGVGVAVVLAWRFRFVRIAAGAATMCLLAWTVSGLSAGRDTIVG